MTIAKLLGTEILIIVFTSGVLCSILMVGIHHLANDLVLIYHLNYWFDTHNLFFRYEPLCVSLYPLEVNW